MGAPPLLDQADEHLPHPALPPIAPGAAGRLRRGLLHPPPHGGPDAAPAAARRHGRGDHALPPGHGLQRPRGGPVPALPEGRRPGEFRRVPPPRGARPRPGDRADARTFELTAAALAIALCLAIPSGIVSAVKRNTLVDYVSTVVALLGQSMPTFWLRLILILGFLVQFPL